jgi:hypothetical protein
MFSARVRAGLLGLVMVLSASAAFAQAPTLTGSADGSTVSLSWTAVDGATGYDVLVQVSGITLAPIPAGGGTSATVPNVPPGTYLIAVRATAGGAQGPLSNVVTVAVTGAPAAPPAAPTNLAASVSNNSVLLSWDLPTTTGLSALILQAGTSLGASDLVTFPFRVSTSTFLPHVPNGTYFLRLFAVGAGGPSAASNELTLVVPACTPPASLPFTVSSQGGVVQGAWAQIPGALGYRLDASSTPGGAANLGSVPIAATETGFSLFGVPTGTYYLTLHTTLSCGAAAKSAEQALEVTAPVRLPAKGLGEAQGMVLAAGRATGGIGGSCGSSTWLFRVLQRLRQQDNRFGLNWKRGNFGDMSHDVILYNHSEVPDDQARAPHTYAWDVIGGHCGPNPSAQANNITNPSGLAGWTILPYLNAGYTP